VSVYVDHVRNWGWRLGPNAHLFADSLEELHAFARTLGLRSDWFQNRPDFPHYDLTGRRHAAALRHGATLVSNQFVFERLQVNRAAREATP
jgi:hypothetical protein